MEIEKTSGIDLLRAIRAHDRTRRVPVLMMTASRNVEYVTSAKIGADGYILKSFDRISFKAKMLEILARRRMRERE